MYMGEQTMTETRQVGGPRGFFGSALEPPGSPSSSSPGASEMAAAAPPAAAADAGAADEAACIGDLLRSLEEGLRCRVCRRQRALSRLRMEASVERSRQALEAELRGARGPVGPGERRQLEEQLADATRVLAELQRCGAPRGLGTRPSAPWATSRAPARRGGRPARCWWCAARGASA
ncbi:unnamed protein product [Prorocentrum cordatum]|uniref:Uncharacterized protein n=1 Tax=Prorocentrum cordatum TaxID=2364126 RepID=A0ABN9W5K0_9DINO|nr:unnamed protein product [Polarella glacialis]